MTLWCLPAGQDHARQVVTVHVADGDITIDLDGDGARTVRRTTTQPSAASKPSNQFLVTAQLIARAVSSATPMGPLLTVLPPERC